MAIERMGNELVCLSNDNATLVERIVEQEHLLNGSGAVKNILVHPAGTRDKAKKNFKTIKDIFDRISIPNTEDAEEQCLCVRGVPLEELVAKMSAMGLISEHFRNEILGGVELHRRVGGK